MLQIIQRTLGINYIGFVSLENFLQTINELVFGSRYIWASVSMGAWVNTETTPDNCVGVRRAGEYVANINSPIVQE